MPKIQKLKVKLIYYLFVLIWILDIYWTQLKSTRPPNVMLLCRKQGRRV